MYIYIYIQYPSSQNDDTPQNRPVANVDFKFLFDIQIPDVLAAGSFHSIRHFFFHNRYPEFYAMFFQPEIHFFPTRIISEMVSILVRFGRGVAV